LSLFALLALAPSRALADGKRDLEDGIAFYENLDTDRALERLSAAAKAPDLPAKDRARAYLYLGMVHFENGGRAESEKAWKSAFEREKTVEVPKGTSPKTIEAIETARATSAKPPTQADEPGDRPRDPTVTPDIKTKPDQKDQNALPDVKTNPDQKTDDKKP